MDSLALSHYSGFAVPSHGSRTWGLGQFRYMGEAQKRYPKWNSGKSTRLKPAVPYPYIPQNQFVGWAGCARASLLTAVSCPRAKGLTCCRFNAKATFSKRISPRRFGHIKEVFEDSPKPKGNLPLWESLYLDTSTALVQ